MEKDRYKRIELRPHEAGHIELEEEMIHPSYELEYDSSAKAGPTGLLRLFRLKSRNAALPNFDGRWDIRQNAVDIDLLGPKEISRSFKSQAAGYRGHHSKALGDNHYYIDIAIPGVEVFRGTLELEATGIVYLLDEFKLGGTDSVTIIDTDTEK